MTSTKTRTLNETTPTHLAAKLAEAHPHLTVAYEHTGGNVWCIVAGYADTDRDHATDYLTDIYVGTGSGESIGWANYDGIHFGEFDDIAVNEYDLERFATNAPLGPGVFDALYAGLSGVLAAYLTPRPANTFNEFAIVDLTVDETGRWPVPDNYYPRRVREAVEARPTSHGPWCDEDDILIPCEACTSNDGQYDGGR